MAFQPIYYNGKKQKRTHFNQTLSQSSHYEAFLPLKFYNGPKEIKIILYLCYLFIYCLFILWALCCNLIIYYIFESALKNLGYFEFITFVDRKSVV